MKYKIIHETEYTFSSKVFYEPHYFRFKPKTTPYNKLEFFNLTITPLPTGISEQTDSENNIVHFCWFEEMTKSMSIKSESIINIAKHNPFNFILYPMNYFDFPFTYSEELKKLNSSALAIEKIDEPLIQYGAKIASDSNFKTIPFLTNLTTKIHDDFILESRQEGIPFEPDKTFEIKNGSCRDLVWMQIQLLRHMGIAAKFVSGYFYLPLENSEFELHAWLEVFLPGAGWIGFDPSHGILAGNSHIPIASSTHFENTMTVTGTIRGEATSDLISKVMIELVT
ncbi:MAG: transglutaminase family protein [Ignavibacteriales bacterium]|nr:transglutaminase family protein [Ignavibacteriales bacterium]